MLKFEASESYAKFCKIANKFTHNCASETQYLLKHKPFKFFLNFITLELVKLKYQTL